MHTYTHFELWLCELVPLFNVFPWSETKNKNNFPNFQIAKELRATAVQGGQTVQERPDRGRVQERVPGTAVRRVRGGAGHGGQIREQQTVPGARSPGAQGGLRIRRAADGHVLLRKHRAAVAVVQQRQLEQAGGVRPEAGGHVP